ncbi:MAG: response regulator transcription factor [Planctomycetota bacterium]|nr:response regulator transcription factor [Planctomycetota bacterium]
MNKLPTMIIADDHPMLRDGLREQFSAAGGFSVVATASDAQSAVNLCREHRPDVLLLDVEMPGRDALCAMADVKVASPGTRIVILTAFCRDVLIDLAVRGGAVGYLLKSETGPAIVAALRQVMQGERAYSKDVLARLSRPGRAATQGDSALTLLSTLSPRELEVLRYIGLGQDNATMARAMHISIRTVERHVLRLMRRMNIDKRTRLTVIAHQSGLVA